MIKNVPAEKEDTSIDAEVHTMRTPPIAQERAMLVHFCAFSSRGVDGILSTYTLRQLHTTSADFRRSSGQRSTGTRCFLLITEEMRLSIRCGRLVHYSPICDPKPELAAPVVPLSIYILPLASSLSLFCC